MTIPADTQYPEAATNTTWQKKKGFINKTKVGGKTGLGPKLKAAEAEWDEIRWAQMDGARVGQADSLVEAKENRKRAQGALMGVQQTRRLVNDARTKAGQTAGMAVLSQSARTYATTIANALKEAYDRLGTVSLDEFDDEVARHEKLISDRQAAEREARKNLTNVTVSLDRATVFTSDKATRTDDHTVIVEGVTWKISNQDSLLGKKLKVDANFHDGGKFINDMKATDIAGRKVTLRVQP